jgi:hypothetical protein
MSKIRTGNKLNSYLNGEWAKHGGKFGKKLAAGRRRKNDKKEITIGLIDYKEGFSEEVEESLTEL